MKTNDRETYDLAFTPALFLRYDWPTTAAHRVGLGAVSVLLEEIRKEIKHAACYFWDDLHLYLTDEYGRPAMKALISKTTISIWDVKHSISLGDFHSIAEYEAFFIQNRTYKGGPSGIEKLQNGLLPCNMCRQWIEFKDGHRYSYAGFVCKTCYDPKKHLPPDTRD